MLSSLAPLRSLRIDHPHERTPRDWRRRPCFYTSTQPREGHTNVCNVALIKLDMANSGSYIQSAAVANTVVSGENILFCLFVYCHYETLISRVQSISPRGAPKYMNWQIRMWTLKCAQKPAPAKLKSKSHVDLHTTRTAIVILQRNAHENTVYYSTDGSESVSLTHRRRWKKRNTFMCVFTSTHHPAAACRLLSVPKAHTFARPLCRKTSLLSDGECRSFWVLDGWMAGLVRSEQRARRRRTDLPSVAQYRLCVTWYEGRWMPQSRRITRMKSY